uniref:Gustatory receptor n=1 Tax=Anopheles coluzzii TaxID=1518534 RepID=A0A6E8W0Q6_ANOCL
MVRLCAKLRVLFFVSNVLYLVPCRYCRKENKFKVNPYLSLLAFGINISLASVHLCFDWLQIWNGERRDASRIFNFLQMLHTLTLPVTIVYMHLIAFTKRVRITALFNALFTDRSWRFFGDRSNSWYESSRWLGRFATAITIGTMLYLSLLILSQYNSSTKFPLYVTILEAVRVYVTMIAILIYIVCVLVVKMHFRQLQDRVEQFGASVNTARQWCLIVDRYGAAVNLVNEINHIFSELLLVMLVQVQVQLCCQYFILFCSTVDGLVPIVTGLTVLHTQLWESLFLLMLLVVGYACDSCHNQIQDVNVAVRNNVGSLNMQRVEARKWIDRFLLQKLSQTNQQRFMAGGLFVLDNKLVCTALTSMITYLVILIQFRKYDFEDYVVTFRNDSNISF